MTTAKTTSQHEIADAAEVAPALDERLTHNFAEVNGVRLHYVGVGEGELLLFVHGFPTFWYTWRNQLEALGGERLAVAPDMRGYNLSSKPKGPANYWIRLMVEDLRALVEHLGYQRFTLVGDDWGGLVSWAFALHYPELLERLVILSSPHPACFDRELHENPDQQQASQYLLALRTPGIENALAADGYAQLAADVHGFPFFTKHDRRCYQRSWSQPGGLSGGLDWYRAAWLGPESDDGTPAHGDYVPEIVDQRVRVPTLVIKAEGCPYFLAGTLNGLDDYVSELTVERVPSESHWIAEEKPQIVNRLIGEFVSS